MSAFDTGAVPERDDVVDPANFDKPCRSLEILRCTECFWPNEPEPGKHYVEVDELLLLGHYCLSHKDNMEDAKEWREDGGMWVEVDRAPKFAKQQLVVFGILSEDFDLSRIVFEDQQHNMLHELPPFDGTKMCLFRAHVLPAQSLEH